MSEIFSIIGSTNAGAQVGIYSPNTGMTTGTVSNSGISGGVSTPHGTIYPT